jgi:hypothetical protein
LTGLHGNWNIKPRASIRPGAAAGGGLMKARDPNEVQRHLDKLAESQRWAHHVADNG